MTKRKYSESTNLESLDTFFHRIATVISDSRLPFPKQAEALSERRQFAKHLINELKHLSTAPAGKTISKAARDFTLEQTIHTFGLNYSLVVSFATREKQTWKIAELPETKGFPMTPCLASLVENYSKNFDRASEAVCRTGIDFILNECLTVMKDNHNKGHGDRGPTTPTPWDNIKVYGEVSFSHKIVPRNAGSALASSATTVTGRVDHGIGRALAPSGPAAKRSRRRFETLLLVVEAKANRNVDDALPQLLTYMACIHQSRVQRLRSDASVYGVSSDGYKFIFVTIGHDGSVKVSRRFDITQGDDLLDVLGCLRYILEISASMSPNMTPEKNKGDGENRSADIYHEDDTQIDIIADPAIDVDDNDYMNPVDDDDDDEEEEEE